MATTKATELGQLGSKLTVHNDNITLDGNVHGQYAGFDSDFTNALSSNISVAGNIAVTGTVDGRDVAADGTKLDGIEAAATADQTAAEIRTLVGNATNSNVFTDSDHSKLDGIETAATADQTKSDIEGLGINVPAANLTGTIPAARLSTATTQAESDDSTKIATTAYVVDKITTLIGGAPSTLNDLNELAAAINDDANYNSTLTTALATKLPLAGGTLTGDIDMSSHQIVFNNNSQAIQIRDAGGTASYVFYQDNADTLVVGNGTTVEKIRLDTSGNEGALVIDTDGKVGIGTASPQEKLEVNGVLQIRRDGDHPALRFAEINSGTTTTRGYIASGDWAVNGGAIDDFGISGSVTGDLLLATNAGSERLRIQNSTGNVGIGTSSPDGQLHLFTSDASITPDADADDLIIEANGAAGITIGSSASSVGSIRFADSGSPRAGMIYYDHVGNAMRLYTQATERMRIDASGNVGIGTTTPDVTSDGNSSRTYVGIIGSGNRGRLNLGTTAANGADVGMIAFTNGSNTLGSVVMDSNSGVQNAGQMYITTSDDMTIRAISNITYQTTYTNSTAGHHIFKSYNTEIMRVDGANNRVGIGTNSPGNPLHVTGGDVGGVVKVEQTVATNTPTLFIKQTGQGGNNNVNQGLLIEVDGSNSGDGNIIKAIGTNSNLNGGADVHAFVVKNSGKVGIGTSSPQQLLHIHNSSGNFGAEAVLTGRLSAGTPKAEVAFKRGTSGDGAMLVLRSSNVSGSLIDAVTVKDGTGNVGIGVTNPATPLQIYQSTNATGGDQKPTPVLTLGAHTNSDNEGPAIEFNSVWVNSGTYLATSVNNGWGVAKIAGVYDDDQGNGGALSFYTNEGPSATSGATSSQLTEKMRIKPNGKVGIGTTSPEYPLQISGSNVSSGGQFATVGIYDTGTPYNGTDPGGGITFRGKYNSAGSLTNFATIQGIKENGADGNYDTALRFTTRSNGGNLSEKMRIASNGYVAIGGALANVQYPLHVNPGTAGYYQTVGINEHIVGFNTSYDSSGSQSVTLTRLDGNWLDGTTGADSSFGWHWNYQNSVRAGIHYDHRSTEQFNFWSSYAPIVFATAVSTSGNGVHTNSNIVDRMVIMPGSEPKVGIGTTSPAVNKGLHIRGGLNVEQQASDPNNITGHDTVLQVSKLDNKDWTADFVGNTSSATDYGVRIKTTSGAVYGFGIHNGSTYTLRIQGNGNVLNSNNSYGSISDIKLKENIVDATSQWDDIKAVRVRKYSFKSDQLDAPNQLGVIAQELESAGMNGLVTSTPDIDDDKNLTGTSTKEVKYSVLYMKAIKALQEAMTKIETLETQVSDLTTRIDVLEE